MSSTTYFEHKLSQAFEPKQAKLLAETLVEAYDELVKSKDFNELKSIVREIAEAQKGLTIAQQRTEQRMEELTIAQQRTEQRMEELTVAQQHTEQRMEELTIAQQHTEQRMEELTIAQQRTEQRMEELTVAQQRTEQSLRELIKEHQETRKQVGGLATTIGYSLENKAYKVLPQLLQRDFGLIVQGRLKRGYLKDNQGKELEVNIIGQALQESKTVTIIGESKSQLSKQKIDEFIRKRLQRFEGVISACFPILITHMISDSSVEKYAKNKGIAVYYSYDFE
jgi:chromosome segregation ATPase